MGSCEQTKLDWTKPLVWFDLDRITTVLVLFWTVGNMAGESYEPSPKTDKAHRKPSGRLWSGLAAQFLRKNLIEALAHPAVMDSRALPTGCVGLVPG